MIQSSRLEVKKYFVRNLFPLAGKDIPQAVGKVIGHFEAGLTVTLTQQNTVKHTEGVAANACSTVEKFGHCCLLSI